MGLLKRMDLNLHSAGKGIFSKSFLVPKKDGTRFILNCIPLSAALSPLGPMGLPKIHAFIDAILDHARLSA